MSEEALLTKGIDIVRYEDERNRRSARKVKRLERRVMELETKMDTLLNIKQPKQSNQKKK